MNLNHLYQAEHKDTPPPLKRLSKLLYVHRRHNLINPGLANPIIAARTNLHSAQLLDFSILVTITLYFSQALNKFDSQFLAQWDSKCPHFSCVRRSRHILTRLWVGCGQKSRGIVSSERRLPIQFDSSFAIQQKAVLVGALSRCAVLARFVTDLVEAVSRDGRGLVHSLAMICLKIE